MYVSSTGGFVPSREIETSSRTRDSKQRLLSTGFLLSVLLKKKLIGSQRFVLKGKQEKEPMTVIVNDSNNNGLE